MRERSKRFTRRGLRAKGYRFTVRQSPSSGWIEARPIPRALPRSFLKPWERSCRLPRVHRPTDNALTERFYGTIKQEEIYLVGNYPDEISAREEIGRYLDHYHHTRPHQSLMNFTPAHVHQVNNKSLLLAELAEMKRKTRERRKAYWAEKQKDDQPSVEGGCPDKGQSRSVDPRANTEAVFQHQPPDSRNENPPTENYSLDPSILSQ